MFILPFLLLPYSNESIDMQNDNVWLDTGICLTLGQVIFRSRPSIIILNAMLFAITIQI